MTCSTSHQWPNNVVDGHTCLIRTLIFVIMQIFIITQWNTQGYANKDHKKVYNGFPGFDLYQIYDITVVSTLPIIQIYTQFNEQW